MQQVLTLTSSLKPPFCFRFARGGTCPLVSPCMPESSRVALGMDGPHVLVQDKGWRAVAETRRVSSVLTLLLSDRHRHV